MTLPLTLGHSSSNEPFPVNLVELPHLFISYSDESQFTLIIKKFCGQLADASPYVNFRIAMAVNEVNSAVIRNCLPASFIFREYITNQQDITTPDSGRMFMKDVFNEYKKRSARAKKALHKPKPTEPPPLLFFADDIFPLVMMNRRKILALHFMELLLMGPKVGVHCIVATCASFSNLMKQLMQVNPALKTLLEKHQGEVKFPVSHTLGAELVLTGEGLLFYKNGPVPDFIKLYP